MRQFVQLGLISSVAILNVTNCKKITYRNAELDGKAIAINDNTPLVGYSVTLLETEISSKPFGPVTIKEIASTTITSDGSFRFEEQLNKRSRFEYSVVFEKANDYFFPYRDGLEMIAETASVQKVSQQNVDLKLARGAFLKFQVYNINSFDDSDQIVVGVDNGYLYLEYTGYTGGGGTSNENFNNRTQFKPTFSGNVEIQWRVIRNGQTSYFSDSIHIEQNEERIYEIQY